VTIQQDNRNGSISAQSAANPAELLRDAIDPGTNASQSAAPEPAGGLPTDMAGRALTEAEKAKLKADYFFLKRRCAELEEQLMALNMEIAWLVDDPASDHSADAMPHAH
jgi:hypothetical protein